MSAPIPQSVSFGRRFLRWFLISVGLCVAPIVMLGVVVASCLMLDRDTAVLREEVMDATGADWSPKVQLSIGRGIIGTTAAGLYFVNAEGVDDARLAIKAVRNASVGVYERRSKGDDWSREELFRKTDHAMAERGWSRMVGVADGKETVLIYTQDESDPDADIDLCIAVVNPTELVVVSTTVNGEALGQLVARHTGGLGSKTICVAGMRF